MATLPSLDAGFSRQLFIDWAGNPRNAVVFVAAAEEGTLAEHVQQLAAAAQQQAQQQAQGAPTMQLVRSRRVPLEGQELEDHLAAQQAEQEAAAAAAAAAQAAEERRQMAVDAAAAAAAKADGGGGGLMSPRASGSVPRANSLAIGHLHSRRGAAAVVGQVLAPDGQPVEQLRGPSSTAAEACLVEGFEVPRVSEVGCPVWLSGWLSRFIISWLVPGTPSRLANFIPALLNVSGRCSLPRLPMHGSDPSLG